MNLMAIICLDNSQVISNSAKQGHIGLPLFAYTQNIPCEINSQEILGSVLQSGYTNRLIFGTLGSFVDTSMKQ